MFPLAESGAAKIKAQYGKPEVMQRLHRVKDNFVMQRPAIDRMWMANYSSMSRVLRPGIH
jgi:hypothetical protein